MVSFSVAKVMKTTLALAAAVLTFWIVASLIAGRWAILERNGYWASPVLVGSVTILSALLIAKIVFHLLVGRGRNG